MTPWLDDEDLNRHVRGVVSKATDMHSVKCGRPITCLSRRVEVDEVEMTWAAQFLVQSSSKAAVGSAVAEWPLAACACPNGYHLDSERRSHTLRSGHRQK